MYQKLQSRVPIAVNFTRRADVRRAQCKLTDQKRVDASKQSPQGCSRQRIFCSAGAVMVRLRCSERDKIKGPRRGPIHDTDQFFTQRPYAGYRGCGGRRRAAAAFLGCRGRLAASSGANSEAGRLRSGTTTSHELTRSTVLSRGLLVSGLLPILTARPSSMRFAFSPLLHFTWHRLSDS